ncbi:hypothetical protein F7725_012873, partial [Dissostichus mawsoni]
MEAMSRTRVHGDAGRNSDMIKPLASGTSDRKCNARCDGAACVHPVPIHAFLTPMLPPPPGPCPSVSPPVSNPPLQLSRSLSEARFKALRQEYQQYRQAQGSSFISDRYQKADLSNRRHPSGPGQCHGSLELS